MRTFGMLLLVVLTALPAVAQTPDPSRFLPLEVGNEWQFTTTYASTWRENGNATTTRVTFGESYTVVGSEHVGDTLYARVLVTKLGPNAPSTSTLLWRFDPRLDGFFQRLSTGGERYVWGVLSNVSSRGSASQTPPFGWSEDTRIFGSLSFECGLGGVALQYNRGPYHIGSSTGSAYGCSSTSQLAYARVGDIEYGQRIVASEAAERPETASLRLWPNPSRGAVTVEAAPRASVVAFDLLGREAVRTVAGADGRAALTLAPGMYVVAAGSQRQTLVVR